MVDDTGRTRALAESQEELFGELSKSLRGTALKLRTHARMRMREKKQKKHHNEPRILVVDDGRSTHQLFQRILRPMVRSIDCVLTGEQGLRLVELRAYDLIFVDVVLGERRTGPQYMGDFRARAPNSAIVLMSGIAGSDDLVELAALAGADAWLNKNEDLVARVRELARQFIPQIK